MTELEAFRDRVITLTRPEDLFGDLGPSPRDAGKALFHRFARVCHADRYQTAAEKAVATTAFQALHALWVACQARIDAGTYGTAAAPAAADVIIKTKRQTYTLTTHVADGDVASVWRATTAEGDDVLVKVAHSHHSNAFLQREAKALAHIATVCADTKLESAPLYYPALMDSTIVVDATTKASRAISVLAWHPGFVTLTELWARFPTGIDGRHVVWIGNRLWTALAFAHQTFGLVHGAVLPTHVLIHPDTHGLQLIDWTLSLAAPGTVQTAISKGYRAWYPPEVLAKRPATPATDLYMAARCLTYLAGGDPQGTPTGLAPSLRRLLLSCAIPNQARRPTDAWALAELWQQAARDAYGPPKYVKLALTHG